MPIGQRAHFRKAFLSSAVVIVEKPSEIEDFSCEWVDGVHAADRSTCNSSRLPNLLRSLFVVAIRAILGHVHVHVLLLNWKKAVSSVLRCLSTAFFPSPSLKTTCCSSSRWILRAYTKMIRTHRMPRTSYYFNTIETTRSSCTQVPDVAALRPYYTNVIVPRL